MPTLMTSGPVARLLGCSQRWVHALDAQLKPTRTDTGIRLYDRSVVEAYRRAKAGR